MPPRIELTALRSADRDDFLAAMRASRSLHRPWVYPPATDAAFAELLERTRSGGSDFRLLRLREDRTIVGYFHVSQIIRGPLQSAFLGYGGVATHAGRGYMSEGMQLLLRHAFGELRLHRLVQPGNAASIALVRRAGFVREGFSERYLKVGGRWRDHERWAIRAEQWRELTRGSPRITA